MLFNIYVIRSHVLSDVCIDPTSPKILQYMYMYIHICKYIHICSTYMHAIVLKFCCFQILFFISFIIFFSSKFTVILHQSDLKKNKKNYTKGIYRAIIYLAMLKA